MFVQAPQKGGPFIPASPQLLKSLTSRFRATKFVANCCIVLGAGMVTLKAIQAKLAKLERARWAESLQ